MNITKHERRRLRGVQLSTPKRMYARAVSIAHRSTPFSLRRLVAGVKNVSIFLLDSNVNGRGLSLYPSVRLRATTAGISKFVQVIGTTCRCFRRRNGKRVTIVDSVTNAGKLKSTPTCSTAGQFRGACLSTLSRLTRVGGLRVSFASVHPKFITAPLLGSSGCPLLVRTPCITSRVMETVSQEGEMTIVSQHCRVLIFF